MSINLTATNHSLEVVTSAALALDAQVSFAERLSGAETQGSQTAAISTATTTTACAAPGASAQRVINGITLVAKGAGSQTVTVQKDVGGSDFVVFGPATLTQGERVEYTHDSGWRRFDSGGSEVRFTNAAQLKLIASMRA